MLYRPLVDFEQEEHAKPVCSHVYPVPKSHGNMPKKEIKHLENIGVLKHAHDSKWGAPSFAQPKKNGTV